MAVNTLMTNALASLPVPTACGYSLYGSTLTTNAQNPLGNLISNTVTETVTPNGLINLVAAPGYNLIDSTITVGASSIEEDYNITAQADVSSFNGSMYQFTNTPAKISSCSLDPSSSFTSSQVIVTCNNNTVFVNESGIMVTPNSKVLINLTLTGP